MAPANVATSHCKATGESNSQAKLQDSFISTIFNVAIKFAIRNIKIISTKW